MNQLASKLGVLALLLGTAVGCNPSVRTPRLYNPGPAGYQRYQADHYYDPYPLPDAGPEIVGGRPRDFQAPRPEVERARQYTYERQQKQFVVPAPQANYIQSQPTYAPVQ
ncbi:hypothetical protein [Aeoliella mucimassa]|uniref:Uncharacterized protein n=1 Tax=Aeoliella mucimassa TaxID=2527972 RepID=A0A518ANH9_9BACT|nr:hypothetical protein [Aeoliella mucimassa]QDU56251.1 hypothetical protein Pan181_24590 [Aeoliella mucimassa]